MEHPKNNRLKEVHFLSDFPLLMSPVDADGHAVPVGAADFVLEFTSGRGARPAYIASRRQGVCSPNCSITPDGQLRVAFESHGLPPGQLRVRWTTFIPDASMPDGIRRVSFSRDCPVVLVREGGCTEPPMEGIAFGLVLPYIYADAYRLAVEQGYTGSAEEYNAALADVPETVAGCRALASLAAETAMGKTMIAEALTAQGVPTDADAPMAQMADGVRSLYAAPTVDEGSRDRTVRGSALMRYDIINELNRHRRADMPYSFGMTFTGDDAEFPQGADGWLLSDGTRLGAEGGAHTFADGEVSHYAICYFSRDFYSVPWPAGVEMIDCAAVDSHPCISRSTAPAMVSLVVDADPADYTGYDMSLPTNVGSAVIGGVETLGGGASVCADSQLLMSLSMPHLKSCRRGITGNCANLIHLELPALELAEGRVFTSAPSLRSISLPKLQRAPSGVGNAPLITSLCLPALKMLGVGADSFLFAALTELDVPSLETIFFGNGFLLYQLNGIRTLRLPSLVEATGNGGLLRQNSNVDVYLPQLRNCKFGLNWGSSNIRVHFGSQQGVTFDMNDPMFTEITVEPGFVGSLAFPKATALTADCLRTLLERLGDNTGGTTHRIQMGADNVAKLTADEIAVATAKNYTVS